MSDTWTAISGYTPQEYTDTAVFEVNSDTKKIALITGQALVAGEENAQYIKFLMPRYWDGIDIKDKDFYVEYALAGTYYGKTAVVNAEYNDEKVRFGWVVPKEACCISGTLLFVLRIESTDYVLKTQIAEHPVFKSVNVEDVVPEPTKEAWYRDFAARVEVAIDEAEAALAQAQQAVVSAETAAQNAQTAENNAEQAAASTQIRYGSPLTAAEADEMIEQNRVYVYVGSESGYTYGHWYYHNGTEWTDGGVYNSSAVNTDTTLTQSGMAADAKITGDKINSIVNSAYVTDSASGAVAHFVDGADDVPMKSVKVNIAPAQSGSGDPSPDNVRPITGWDTIKVYHSGENTEEATEYNISLASAGTVYGGTLDAVSGVLTVDREYVLMTAELWKAWNDSAKAAYTDGVYQNREIMACDSLKAGELVTNGIKVRTTDGRIGALPQWAESCTTIAEFKTALANNPAINIVITLATPLTYQLSAQEVKSLLGINNVWSDAGDMDVEYRADTKLYIKRLTDSDTDMIADANIVSGQYFMVGNDLYKATVNIASGAQIVVGTNATKVSLAQALNEINA